MKIEGWRGRLLLAIAYRVLQVWARTIRFEIDDRVGVLGKRVSGQFIAALWHNRLLFLPWFLRRFIPERHGVGLISASRDGDLATELVKRFGFEVVRGSSSRQGATAMLQLAELLAHGRDVVITPDGPRGPVYQVGPGIIFLAQKTGAAIAPLHIEYSNCWRLKSWDRFILPRPFSKAYFIFGSPLQIAQTNSDEEFERERQRLQNAMMQLVERP